MPNLFYAIRNYFSELCAQPEDTLEARISRQVKSLQSAAIIDSQRLRHLEARAENLDAFYVKTVGTALKDHFDGEVAKLWTQVTEDYQGHKTRVEAHEGRIASLQDQIAAVTVELGKVNGRLTSFISSLRNLGEV